MLLFNFISKQDFFLVYIETRLTFQFKKSCKINDHVFDLYKQHRNHAF